VKTRILFAVVICLAFSHCAVSDTMQQWAATGIPGPGGPAVDSPESAPHPSSPWAETPESEASFPLEGEVTESPTGNRTYRNRQTGAITGSEWTSPAGTTTYRDGSGRILGSSSESPAGTRTYRDGRGAIAMDSSTSEGTGGDNTTTYRRNGEIVGTKYVSPAGNVTWRDGGGRIIDGPSEMKP
jgi:hypothetical protein